MEIKSGVTRSIIDELHSCDIQRDQMVDESDVAGSIIIELHFQDTQGDLMAGESCVT